MITVVSFFIRMSFPLFIVFQVITQFDCSSLRLSHTFLLQLNAYLSPLSPPSCSSSSVVAKRLRLKSNLYRLHLSTVYHRLYLSSVISVNTHLYKPNIFWAYKWTGRVENLDSTSCSNNSSQLEGLRVSK